MNRNAWREVLAAACLMGLTSCATPYPTIRSSNVTPSEAIAATGGTPQSHSVNGTFASALVATVTTNGGPASGLVVIFTAPASGASATFSDTTAITASATTDSNGVATSPVFAANGTAGIYAITAAVSGAVTPAIFTLTNTTGAPAAISATAGTPQSASINTAFPAPLVATVVDSGKNPVSGAVVTFTAPATGASGTFANGTATETDTTNASGLATSTTFTANGTSGADTVTATAAGVSAAANFNLTNAAGAPATVMTSSGTPQSTTINTAFAAPLVAAVFDSSLNPVGGVAVTFTAPATGATGTFANGTATETDTTNASGLATSTTFTANGTTGGPYTVAAKIAASSTAANFSLTNRIAANTYVFYLSGQEASGPNFYALAGSVEISPNGNVLAGEQDYNDGFAATSPQPSGDTISGGTLSVNTTTGQGTLTLTTNNPTLGLNGVETLGVQFVNSNHALIIQFDGTATSSGSMDLQTSPALSGGYAFTLSGVDNVYGAVGFGGVFSVTAGTLLSGSVDENDNGALTTATPLSGTFSTFDSFGRGTIISNLNYAAVPIVLNYYVVGPEAIRIIDVDPVDSAIGSAFGQGVNQTSSSNASLGNSVFGLQGDPFLVNFATVGMVVPSPSLGTFSGVADDNELFNYNIQLPADAISGTYSIASNGYGNFTITPGDLGDVATLGIYMTDPHLNLSDPNNTTSGLGGALLTDMDSLLAGGIGVMLPQTDTSSASFAGNYAFGAQDFYDSFEFDFVGQGSVTGGALSGTGLVSDPFDILGTSATDFGATFSGTPLADPTNVGRYTMFSTNPTPNPLNITIGANTTPFDVVIYQASGGELFWLDEDVSSVFFGSLQQQGSLAGIPGAGSGSTETIVATSGTPQSAATDTAFAAPLVATVTTNGSPTSGVVVTFTAPATGASGTFTGGSNTTTATTNASGVATSPVFTANATAGAYMVTATVAGVSTPANFSLTNTSTTVETIVATSGTPQSTVIDTAFAAPLVATVTTNGSPTSGVLVTFTAPASGASGTFAGGTNTATTNTSGVATSQAFTANTTAGAYTVTATVAGVSTPANFSLTNTAAAVETIVATSGTPQSTEIDTAFAAPLVATVTTNGSPTSGVLVTFTAPATGASGAFTGGTNTITATTNASGVATSPVFTANGTAGAYTVTATVGGVSTPANFSLTNTATAVETIVATSGTPQSAVIDTAFAAPLVATVTTNGSPTSGVVVTFTAPATGASGTFAGGTNAITATTNASGVATSPVFTANGTTGIYAVAATVAGVSAPANFSLTNRGTSNTYVFYLSGQETFGPDFYALAGSVEINNSGSVVAGEQDYNDGGFGFASPEPSGDTITGGTLSVNLTTGQGTLTLITNNTSLGVGGVETLGVQFVNSNHAVIIEFDGVATSSGNMDLQTLPSALSGGYAFTLAGVDDSYGPVAFGGVFSISGGTNLQNGLVDENDYGTVTTATALSGTLSTFDSFGRGTITSTLNYGGVPIALNYYVVGPEAIRIIDVDLDDSAVGSAFGQGVNATGANNASLGQSVFALNGSPYPSNYAAAGMFSTSDTSSALADFSGVADDSELVGFQLPAAPISGTYSIASDGYGSLTMVAGDLGDVSVLGVYMTDPNLNLSDPNNTTSGLGGALVSDMDGVLAGGTGLLIPQTNTSTTGFAGNYAFAAQSFFTFFEFDFVGQGSVTSGAFSGTGLVSDPFITLNGNATNSGVKFSGTPLADPDNVGRYTLFSTNTKPNPLKVIIDKVTTTFDVVLYQSSGGLLFWLNEDPSSVFLGSFQQQGSLTGLPTAKPNTACNPVCKP